MTRLVLDIMWCRDQKGMRSNYSKGLCKPHHVQRRVPSALVKRILCLLPLKFAIVQFSSWPQIHFYFSDFDKSSLENNINSITQLNEGTNTASAIQYVVDNVFIARRGSRENVGKVLIIITDGESQQKKLLPAAVQAAENKKIVRFAIGVGSAFSNPTGNKGTGDHCIFPLQQPHVSSG
ncbi:hypothetical protein fugu_000942 [Takifugu bimaculatus]|uniref:VWFA domain-containing protein n=1 Tax=Takifugu bimaculatus TaxID=433685 RepID=A0A4Z2CI34_9TELE|nr:hypothetical protein fugu_000942 [Takifugu bimaculatus]